MWTGRDARKKYPRDGHEIFWNHTNIHRKYRIEALAFSILAHCSPFPAIYVLHMLDIFIVVSCSIHLIEFNSCQHCIVLPPWRAIQGMHFYEIHSGIR